MKLIQLNQKRALTEDELSRHLSRWIDFKDETLFAPNGGWIRPGDDFVFKFEAYLGAYGGASIPFEDALGEIWTCQSSGYARFDDRRRFTKTAMARTRRKMERQQRLAGDRNYRVRDYFQHSTRLKQWVAAHSGDRDRT